jgi:hypothetical protein
MKYVCMYHVNLPAKSRCTTISVAIKSQRSCVWSMCKYMHVISSSACEACMHVLLFTYQCRRLRLSIQCWPGSTLSCGLLASFSAGQRTVVGIIHNHGITTINVTLVRNRVATSEPYDHETQWCQVNICTYLLEVADIAQLLTGKIRNLRVMANKSSWLYTDHGY